jgi:glyoxylase-like metal-dependent hydrolase (beta-lactamase superfamily II)
MRVHHLNCGTMRPLGGWLFDGSSPGLVAAHLSCHCLLIETEDGLVLVDTGFGTQDLRHPVPRLSKFLLGLDRVLRDPFDTALQQVGELGFKASDVRHIVLTHLDFDHAGGISDFPKATVHVMAEEASFARHRSGFLRRRRYRPVQWRAAPSWREYRPQGEKWFGFEVVRQLDGLPPEILLVPLPGHTPGHAGVAVDTGHGWLLHAGDAYFSHDEVHAAKPSCPPGLRAYRLLMQTDGPSRRRTQAQLRELIASYADSVTVFCSHDVNELQARRRAAEREDPDARRPARPLDLTAPRVPPQT